VALLVGQSLTRAVRVAMILSSVSGSRESQRILKSGWSLGRLEAQRAGPSGRADAEYIPPLSPSDHSVRPASRLDAYDQFSRAWISEPRPSFRSLGQDSKSSAPASERRPCRGCRDAPGRSAPARRRVSVSPWREERLGVGAGGMRSPTSRRPRPSMFRQSKNRKRPEPTDSRYACACATGSSFRAPQGPAATRAFFVRSSSLRRAGEARDQDVPRPIATVRCAKAQASAVADAATLSNR
jgi:hypothetical protein